MKFHRDATVTPQEMAYYQTPATERSTWRADLARIGIIAGIVGIAGVFLVISLYLLTKDLQIVGAGIWLTGLVIVGYLVWYALQSHQDIAARHGLDRARIYAEIDALTTFDVNADGKADTTEVDTFVEYVRRLHRNEPTTAHYAQKKMGIAAPTWTRYKNWLVRKGYAHIEKRQGGIGFRLNDSVLKTPWPRLEEQLRVRIQKDLAADASAPDFDFDPDAVTTLRN